MMLVLSLAITNVVALRRTTCTTDEDCLSDARTYCYEARECVKCLDCSIFLRDPGSKTCAKEKSDCGPCKAGFLAEENIDGSPGHCIKQNIDNKPSDNNNTSHVTDKPNYLMIVLIFMFVFLLFIFAWAEWRYRFCMPIHDEGIISRLSMIFQSNSNNLNTTCPTKEPSAPPLPPPYEEPITNEIQRANMFQTPCYVVGNHTPIDMNNEEPADEVQGQEEDDVTDQQPLIAEHNEETQPSAWVPEQNLAIPPPLDFSGALSDQTSQLTIRQPSRLPRPHSDTPTSDPASDQNSTHRTYDRPINIINHVHVNQIVQVTPSGPNSRCQNQSEADDSTMDNNSDSMCITMPDSC